MPKNFIKSKRTLIITSLLLIVAIAVGSSSVIWNERRNEEPEEIVYPYGDPIDIELPADLAPEDVDPNDPHHFPSLTYGIHTFFWWDPQNRNFGLDTMNLMRFSHIRQNFAWRDIEPNPTDPSLPDDERYIWTQSDAMMDDIEAKGIEVLARLDKPPEWAMRPDADFDEIPFDVERLEDYCRAVATRYQGRIEAYQVWNEPNLTREWANTIPNPVAYVELLDICASAIREADPEAIIVSAGISPTGTRDTTAIPDVEYFWKMYQVEGFSDHFDVLGVHAPGFYNAPETDPADVVAEGGRRWQTFRHVEDIRAIMVAFGDSDKQIAITEFGWTIDLVNPAYSWFAVDVETQADYLVRAYQYAALNYRPWLGLMSTIYLPDPFWTEEDEQFWWAIAEPDIPPFIMKYRPAMRALADMEKISTNPDYDHPQLVDGVILDDSEDDIRE